MWTFVGKITSLLFNMLSSLVIALLPRRKHVLISWLQSPSTVMLEPKKIKSVTVSIVSPSICHEVVGPDAMVLVFWAKAKCCECSEDGGRKALNVFRSCPLPLACLVSCPPPTSLREGKALQKDLLEKPDWEIKTIPQGVGVVGSGSSPGLCLGNWDLHWQARWKRNQERNRMHSDKSLGGPGVGWEEVRAGQGVLVTVTLDLILGLSSMFEGTVNEDQWLYLDWAYLSVTSLWSPQTCIITCKHVISRPVSTAAWSPPAVFTKCHKLGGLKG